MRRRKVLERLAQLIQPQKAVAAKDTDQGHAHMCACVYAYRHAQMSDMLAESPSPSLICFVPPQVVPSLLTRCLLSS